VKYVDLLSPPEVKLEDTRYVAIGASFGAGQSHRLTSGGKAESGVVHDLKQAGSGTFRVAQERAEH
jgi:hypothetical protein